MARAFRWAAVVLLLLLLAGGTAYRAYAPSLRVIVRPMTEASPILPPREEGEAQTVAEVIAACEPSVEEKFAPACRAAGIAYPPKRLRLLAFKQERMLEVWGADTEGDFHRLAVYPFTAASGDLGPKYREGDLQVPEGIYRLTTLNPNSRFHVSVRVDYPNADDIRRADIPADERGGDIYVHGGAVSIGCIALGDAAIEEVFTLSALTPAREREILISPVDFRQKDAEVPRPLADDERVKSLYKSLKDVLKDFPLPAILIRGRAI